MMEAMRASETSIYFSETTRCYISEVCNLKERFCLPLCQKLLWSNLSLIQSTPRPLSCGKGTGHNTVRRSQNSVYTNFYTALTTLHLPCRLSAYSLIRNLPNPIFIHSFSCSSQLEHRAPFGVPVITQINTHRKAPLDEWPARRRGLYLHRTTQHKNARDKDPCNFTHPVSEIRGCTSFRITLCFVVHLVKDFAILFNFSFLNRI
jgi:hypothetical protein